MRVTRRERCFLSCEIIPGRMHVLRNRLTVSTTENSLSEDLGCGEFDACRIGKVIGSWVLEFAPIGFDA